MGIGTIIGGVTSLLGGSSQKKAINKANDAQQAATQAQLQLGRESLDLNKQIYGSNYATLSPFVSRGNVAGESINALLGLPSAPVMQNPLAAGGTGTGGTSGGYSGPSFNDILAMPHKGSAYENAFNQFYSYYAAHPNENPGITSRGQIDALSGDSIKNSENRLRGLFDAYASSPHPQTTGQGSAPGPVPVSDANGPMGGTTPITPINASDAFNNFANSAGMQFQLQQGENAINNGYAARGQLQSGAALKGLQNYGQQTALNNYFLPYLGLLGGQQATGAGAASSIAGVGSNFGNTAAAINSGMGQNIQSGANAASNAALLKGQINNNFWTGIGSSFAQGLGSAAGMFGGF